MLRNVDVVVDVGAAAGGGGGSEVVFFVAGMLRSQKACNHDHFCLHVFLPASFLGVYFLRFVLVILLQQQG